MFVIRSRDWIPVSAVTTARHRNSTYGTLNLILLISRDAIHFWLFVGTLIGLLPSSILTIEGSCNTRDIWYYQTYRVDTEIAT